MKFRKDRPEKTCGKVVPGPESEHFAEYGGIICLRLTGHAGKCIMSMGAAAKADGYCWTCRSRIDEPHEEGCEKGSDSSSK